MLPLFWNYFYWGLCDGVLVSRLVSWKVRGPNANQGRNWISDIITTCDLLTVHFKCQDQVSREMPDHFACVLEAREMKLLTLHTRSCLSLGELKVLLLLFCKHVMISVDSNSLLRSWLISCSLHVRTCLDWVTMKIYSNDCSACWPVCRLWFVSAGFL